MTLQPRPRLQQSGGAPLRSARAERKTDTTQSGSQRYDDEIRLAGNCGFVDIEYDRRLIWIGLPIFSNPWRLIFRHSHPPFPRSVAQTAALATGIAA